MTRSHRRIERSSPPAPWNVRYSGALRFSLTFCGIHPESATSNPCGPRMSVNWSWPPLRKLYAAMRMPEDQRADARSAARRTRHACERCRRSWAARMCRPLASLKRTPRMNGLGKRRRQKNNGHRPGCPSRPIASRRACRTYPPPRSSRRIRPDRNRLRRSVKRHLPRPVRSASGVANRRGDHFAIRRLTPGPSSPRPCLGRGLFPDTASPGRRQ